MGERGLVEKRCPVGVRGLFGGGVLREGRGLEESKKGGAIFGRGRCKNGIGVVGRDTWMKLVVEVVDMEKREGYI